MELKLIHGRPADSDKRLPIEQEVYDFLDHLSIDYDYCDHEAYYTMEACKEEDEILDAAICKNLFLCNASKSKFYLLLLPGEKRFVSKVISKRIGASRLSFAHETFMQELLGVTPGSVTVLGLMHDKDHKVQLVIDQDLLKERYFACHPCINTSSIRFETKDLLEKILPRMGYEPLLIDIEG